MVADYIPLLLTVAVCTFARPIGEWLDVIDHPDGLRKLHAGAVPMVGGIAVMSAVAVWCGVRLLSGAVGPDSLETGLLLSAGGVAVLGFMDDQRMISPGGRLLLLAIFSLAALKLDTALFVRGAHTTSFGFLPMTPRLSVALVVTALVGYSSAVNMADGTTGLVLSLICIWSVCLSLLGGDPAQAAGLLAAASVVTLLFNLRGRLFLGDCGAFAIAFALGLLTIASHNEGRLPVETVIVWFLIPVLDCLRLILLRLWIGRSPFRPDLRHFQHRLANRMGDLAAVCCYAGLVAATSLLATLWPNAAIACMAFAGALYGGFLLADSLAPREDAGAATETGSNIVMFRGAAQSEPAEERSGGP